MYQCKTCFKYFEKSKPGLYCSLECYWESLKNKHTWNYQGEKNRKCRFCKKEFKARNVSKQIFCSKACGNKGKSKKINYWGRKQIICEECNKPFTAWKYEVNRKYCGRECLGKSNGKKMMGENHHNWKGGISPRCLNTVKYKNWRKLVFERDNYICQKCGYSKGRILEAHHIKSWAKYPKLRFDIKNGQTLCKNCHKKTDTFGSKK